MSINKPNLSKSVDIKRWLQVLIMMLLLGMNKSYSQKLVNIKMFLTDSVLPPKEKAELLKMQTLVPVQEINSQLQQLLIKLYDNGYVTASIDSIKKDSIRHTVYLKTGSQFKWIALSAKTVDEQILSKSGYRDATYRNNTFSVTQFSSMVEKMLVYCENNGYPFASIKLDSIKLDDKSIEAKLYLEKNNKITIDSILIKGDAKISPYYLYRYLGITPGSLYNEAEVRNISSRIKSLFFVKESKAYEVYFTEKNADIVLYLDNKKASRINGIAGILPSDDKPGEWQFTGDAEVKLINSMGKGETVNINWKKLSTRTQELNAAFELPYMFRTSFGSELNMGIYIKDTLYRTLDVGGGLQYYFSGNNYVKATIQNTSSAIVSTTGLDNLTTLPSYADFSSTLYGMGIKIENLDYRYNPRKGISVNVNLAAGQKNIEQNQAINAELYEGMELKARQIRCTGKIDTYIPLWRRFVINIGFNGSIINSPTIFENELFRIGGLNTLRGFDDQSILASSFSVVTVEYRYLLEQNSYLNIFFNGAYYENKSLGKSVYDTPYGFGAGINFETKAGIVKVNYALGKQFDNPILLRSGKIHVGLVGLF